MPNRNLQTFASIESMRQWSRDVRSKGRLGFVPTMGALHAGHGQLIIEAGRECEFVAVSIYVNPTQFGPNEDLAKYPRTLQADLDLCRQLGVSAVFLPTDEVMYPNGKNHCTLIEVPRLSTIFEGAIRPGHFQGVATVVTKLFGSVQPDIAYFGRKDYQQWLVIRQMTHDLNLPVALQRVDTVREPDGLAMSSRNRYLSVEERKVSLTLSQALNDARTALQSGERSVVALEQIMKDRINSRSELRLDYARIVNADNLSDINSVDTSQPESAVALIAARVGTTRLIDNIMLPPK